MKEQLDRIEKLLIELAMVERRKAAELLDDRFRQDMMESEMGGDDRDKALADHERNRKRILNGELTIS